MPLHEFWEEEPNLFWAYRFSFYENEKYKRDMANQQAWLQGAYIYEAISIALNNAFSKNRMDYREEPYDLYNSMSKSEREKKQGQINKTEEILKARAKKIEGLLGGNKNE